MDFIRFLFQLEGFVPTFISFIATILSFVFGKYLPAFPPEIWQATLSLLTVVLTAFTAYKAPPAVQRFKAARQVRES